jgi:diguanylate cyclase (GGDEF)-like protein/putative nucleotidyltransferase with HDIG domain
LKPAYPKPPIASASGSSGWTRHLPWASVRGRVVGGFGLLILVLVCVIVGASWQVRRHQNDLEELERHSTTASLLQNVEAQAATAGLLLQRYVDAGGDHYQQEINDHAANAQVSLQQILNQGGSPGLEDVTSSGLRLMQDAARAAQLRRSGDLTRARQVLEEIVPIFREYRLTLENLAAEELARVAELRENADAAGQLAFWLLVASGGIGVIIALLASYTIARSIISPLSALEETARRASDGNLAARAPDGGPRELAHLGSVLNEMMSAIEARAAELRRANKKLSDSNRQLRSARSEAATDPLTGLGNHRSFHKRLREEHARASAAGTPLGLIIIDLDGFKGVNDSRGHLAGDDLLRQVATALSVAEGRDHTYRYGGDELAVLVPGGDEERTMVAADSLRERIAGLGGAAASKITASFGVACYPGCATTAEEMVYRADMAMYWAKSLGKNRVCSWRDLSGAGGTPASYSGDRRGQTDLVSALSNALQAKDHTTRAHAERCSFFAAALAAELGLGEAEIADVRLASLLHDIGKLTVPDEILQKAGPLSGDEMNVMQRHPADGANMLPQTRALSGVFSAVRHHHERFDGTGYPDNLAGEQIPLTSRILLVTDAYDAMTSDRPYRAAMPEDAAMEELRRCSGTQFDPQIVEAFFRVLSRNRASRESSSGAVSTLER